MNKTERALHEMNELDTLAKRNQWMNRLHPLVKFMITVIYLFFVVSFDKYDFLNLLGMFLYPFILFQFADLSIRQTLRYIRLPMIFVLFLSILNPFLETAPYFQYLHITISYGMVSMAVLICKGLFSLLAVYLLMTSTPVEDVCYSLSILHVPSVLILILLLIYRYMSVLTEEVSRTINAYMLRAPLQKGIHWKYWGSLVGQILLRSIDRAEEVYQSMCLRGFQGNFSGKDIPKMTKKDILYFLSWSFMLSLFRFFPVFSALGSLFT